jgi:hypothetical protein
MQSRIYKNEHSSSSKMQVSAFSTIVNWALCSVSGVKEGKVSRTGYLLCVSRHRRQLPFINPEALVCR